MWRLCPCRRRDLGVPRCCGAFTPSTRLVTPSTRLVSIRRGRGWSLFRFWGHSDRFDGNAPRRLAQTRDAKTGQDKRVDPQQLQVQLTGFLNKQAQPFVAELWKLLLDAQDAPHGALRGEEEGGAGEKAGGGRRSARAGRSRTATADASRPAARRAGARRSGAGPRRSPAGRVVAGRPRKRSGFPRLRRPRAGARARRAAAGQARAAAALALEGVAEYAGRLLLC